MMYYQLWHKHPHMAAPAMWVRKRVKSVAAALIEVPAGAT